MVILKETFINQDNFPFARAEGNFIVSEMHSFPITSIQNSL